MMMVRVEFDRTMNERGQNYLCWDRVKSHFHFVCLVDFSKSFRCSPCLSGY
jgi:hypothetical protein